MKITKIFGLVVSLHLGLILLLVVQPGCRTTQPPSASGVDGDGSGRASEDVGPPPDDLIPAVRKGEGSGGLDSAFNAGAGEGTGDDRFAPRRPEAEEDDFGDVPDLRPRRSPGETDGRRADRSVDGEEDESEGEDFETYTVQRGDSLWKIARRNDVPVQALYEANDMNEDSMLREGQEIRIPGGGSGAESGRTQGGRDSAASGDTTVHTVSRGETLSGIARRYDTSVRALREANDKDSDMIRVGEELAVPVEGADGNSGDSAAGSRSSERRSTDGGERSGEASGEDGIHVVKEGEYPAMIARQYGLSTSELLAMNGIDDPRRLKVGQELRVGQSENDGGDSEDSSADSAPSDSGQADSGARGGRGGNRDSASPIRVMEAEPLEETDAADIENAQRGEGRSRQSSEEEEEEEDADSRFDNAEEIPVIRVEE